MLNVEITREIILNNNHHLLSYKHGQIANNYNK